MATATDFSVPERLCLAAAAIGSVDIFSLSQLVVAAWRQFPDAFGLQGFTDQHPDNNKVVAALSGKRGLVQQGLFSRTAPGRYFLTDKGYAVVRRLCPEKQPLPTRPQYARLPPDQEKQLLAFLDAEAVSLFAERRHVEVTFLHACRFWGVSMSKTLSANGVGQGQKIEQVGAALEKLATAVGTVAELSNGRIVSPEEVVQAGRVHELLREKFAKHLAVIRNRDAKAEARG